MLPEISRRCLSCGASVRSEAMFCPECGESLAPRAGDPNTPTAIEETTPSQDSTAEPETVSEPIEGESFAAVREPKKQPESGRASPTRANIRPTKKGQTESSPPSVKTAIASNEEPERARAKTRERLHRASTAARGAIEENVKRVDRIRQVSSVMFEEAHYDASLRFVLVAIFLFVIVAVLLVLSKVMG